jgi:hypothetical protein
MLGLRLLANDTELQAAIRRELERHEPEPERRGQDREPTLASLQQKPRKLLDLHYADQITAEAFAAEETRLAGQIEALRHEDAQLQAATLERDELSDRFEEVAALLATLDIDAVWDATTTAERRVLVEDLVDSVLIHPDRLVVQISGAPPLLVTLAEVGLRDTGTRSSVSEGSPARKTTGVCGHGRRSRRPLDRRETTATCRRAEDSDPHWRLQTWSVA